MATATQTAPEETVTEDDELLVTAANMNIKRYIPVRKPGPYDDQVETLKKVDESTGYPNSIEILVPRGDEKKHKRWFNDSAKYFGRGSRIVNGDLGQPQGADGTLMEFILTDPIVRKDSTPATTADTPTPA